MVFSLWGKAEEPLPRLDGRVIIVTGATAGIGLKTAQRLAELGATVIIACRNVKKGDDVCQQLRTKATTTLDLRVMELDLSSLQSVQKFANDFLALDLPLHVLLNNAGLLHTTYVESQDGLEDMFAVNHLGHFFLTFLLLSRLHASAPARIVNVASDAHGMWPKLEVDTLDKPCEIEGVVQGMRVYGRSKLCNILFSNYLATKLEGTGVTSVSLHPGMVNTDIGKSEGSWWMHVLFAPVRLFIRDVEQGAKTSVWCAASKEAEGVSGKFFDNPGAERTPEPQALDPVVAQQLWDFSCRLVEEKTGTSLVWPLPPPKH
eukprot:EG_transcript_18425